MLPRWTFLPPPPPLALVRCATRGRKGRKSNEGGFASKTLLLFLFPFEYLRAGSAIKNGGRAASSRPPHVGTAPLDPLRSSAFDGFFSLSVSFPPPPSYIRRGFFCKRPLLTPYRSWLLEMEPLAHRAITKPRAGRERTRRWTVRKRGVDSSRNRRERDIKGAGRRK